MSESFASWIGKSVTREDVVTQRLCDAFQATLAPHLFESGDQCPPGLHWCLAVAVNSEENLGSDGAEAKGIFLPPVPLPRRMWAGGQVETIRPLNVDDRIKRTSTVSDIKNREGKAGKMCFVSVTHVITANGELAIRERHDILFREASDSPPVAAVQSAPPESDLAWRVEATPLLLFRFSALTFNSHRIHYDMPYAREVEGYNGLLVHGPLQAALTLNQLSVLHGKVPRRFDYRCVSPLIAGQTFRLMSRREGDAGGSALILNAGGTATIEAKGHE